MSPLKRLLQKLLRGNIDEAKKVNTQSQKRQNPVQDSYKILHYTEDDSKLHKDITRNTLEYLCSRLEPFEDVMIECKADSMAYFIKKHFAASHVLTEYFGEHLYNNMLDIIKDKKTPIGYVKSEDYTGYFKIHSNDIYEEVNEYNPVIPKELYEHHFQDTSHIFYKKKIVIKGELHEITEKEIEKRFKKIGAVLDTSLAVNTDFLIIGRTDTNDYSEIEQLAKGLGINVLNEDSFLLLLKSN